MTSFSVGLPQTACVLVRKKLSKTKGHIPKNNVLRTSPKPDRRGMANMVGKLIIHARSRDPVCEQIAMVI